MTEAPLFGKSTYSSATLDPTHPLFEFFFISYLFATLISPSLLVYPLLPTHEFKASLILKDPHLTLTIYWTFPFCHTAKLLQRYLNAFYYLTFHWPLNPTRPLTLKTSLSKVNVNSWITNGLVIVLCLSVIFDSPDYVSLFSIAFHTQNSRSTLGSVCSLSVPSCPASLLPLRLSNFITCLFPSPNHSLIDLGTQSNKFEVGKDLN